MSFPPVFIENVAQLLWENQHGTMWADAPAEQQDAWRAYVRIALETHEDRKGKVMRWDGARFVEIA